MNKAAEQEEKDDKHRKCHSWMYIEKEPEILDERCQHSGAEYVYLTVGPEKDKNNG